MFVSSATSERARMVYRRACAEQTDATALMIPRVIPGASHVESRRAWRDGPVRFTQNNLKTPDDAMGPDPQGIG